MNLQFALPVFSTKKLLAPFFILLSLLLAAYSPMVSITSAQQAVDLTHLQDLKQKALSELDRRIASYNKTLSTMKIDLTANNTGLNTTVTAGDGSTKKLSLTNDYKTQVKQYLQKVVDELTQLKEKITNTTDLTNMQQLGQNVDNQFGLDQLTNVQSAATQAVQSMTGVFGKLQTAFDNVKSRVTQLKECLKSQFGSVADDTHTPTPSPSGSAANCDEFQNQSTDSATQADSSMQVLSTIMSTIGNIIASAISLLLSLFTSFTGMLGGLGSLGSLGNLGNMANLGSLGSLTSGAGGLGNITGLLSSFTAITQQLDITNGMSGNAFGSLSSLGSLIGI
jgi:hypothetical protein